jgi:DNA (cytosine-5)-methyltransferase 1
MTEELNKIDYVIKVDILNSMTHANIPQNRERVFIVGMLDSTSLAKFIFPEKIKLKKTIRDCLDLKGDSIKPNHIYDERYDCFNIIKKSVLKTDTLYQWRRQYVRENKSNACPTLTANMGSGGHNVPLVLDPVLNKIRKLTPKETANFQGFPPTFKLPSELADSKLYHQFGNSVTVPLIKRIAKNIIDALK